MKQYNEIALELQPSGDGSLFEIGLWRCTADLCKLIANENNLLTLSVIISKVMIYANGVTVLNQAEAKKDWTGEVW